MSLREKILAKRKSFPKEGPIVEPAWGLTADDGVYVRGLLSAERDRFEDGRVKNRGKKNARLDLGNERARLVAIALVDKDGKRVFTDADVTALGEMQADVMDRLYLKACQLSGMADKDIQDEADALEKNPDSSLPTS